MTDNNLIAVSNIPIGSPLEGIGEIGLEGGGNAVSIFARVISTIIGLMTVIAAIYFMFRLISGAISIMSSGGDKAALEDARKSITIGVVGFVVTIAAVFIMDVVATLLGIPNILNIGAMINLIAP